MRIVFDTNILISGFISSTGVPSIVLSRIFNKYEVFISDYILDEFQSKMKSKFKFSPEDLENVVHYLNVRCSFVKHQHTSQIEFSDKRDLPILKLIATAKPNYFITGDKRLLSLKKQGGTIFLSAREAMELL